MTRTTSCARYQGSSKTPREAREAVVSFLAGRVDDDLLTDLLVVTSELVTNAVSHGSSSGPIWLHLLLRPDEVAITVSSVAASGNGPHIARSGLDVRPLRDSHHLAENGRGLAIVREFCDEVTVFDSTYTFVRIVRHLQ